jgi:hypothetical protein
MNIDLEKRIESLKQKLSKLEAKAMRLADEKYQSDRLKVKNLARKLGYKSAELLIKALYGKVLSEPKVADLGSRRKRARITDRQRHAIVAELKRAKLPISKVAEKYNVSVPTVNNIKKSAGLTKSRNRKTPNLPKGV